MPNKKHSKKVPYISFSVDKLPMFLSLVSKKEVMRKDDLILEVSEKFSRSRKTIQEFIISLKNLGLLREENRKISLTESSRRIISKDREDFWPTLREEMLHHKLILEILYAIDFMSRQKIKVKSNEEYYNALSKVLQTKYGFDFASPRELDRFITLFRKLKILDYDPFLDKYFIVRIHDIDHKSLEKIVIKKYEEISNKMKTKTGTFWVPVDQLRSGITEERGIDAEVLDKFFKKAIGGYKFQFAEASASRREVRKGGIKKNGKIYYYMKITG